MDKASTKQHKNIDIEYISDSFDVL